MFCSSEVVDEVFTGSDELDDEEAGLEELGLLFCDGRFTP